MQPHLSIQRYCYLGTFLPVYQIKRGLIDVENLDEISLLVEKLTADQFIEIIEKALKSNNLPRRDELWYVYASYFVSKAPDNFKIQAKQAFPRLAKTSDDLFLFAKYSKLIQDKLNRNGFSKSTRKIITLWYKHQESGSVIDMWSKNRGLHGLTHRELAAMCHINPKDLNQDDALVLKINRCSNLLKEQAVADAKTEQMKKLNDVCKFKTTGDLVLAKRLIKEKKLKFENVPAHFLRKLDIWEILVPVMTYRQLLKSVHYLIDKKLLDNVAFSKIYLRALGNRDAMQNENIHPVTFLIEKNQLIKQVRYSEAIKQNFYEKKIRPLDIKPNLYLNNKISKIFDHSFENYRGVGTRAFITINLQENTKRQCVINQKQVNCFDAAVSLALAYFKSEKSSVAFTFSPANVKLKQIEWKRNWNFTKASDYCAGLLNPKTKQSLNSPIAEAINRNEEFDLFLIVVPSGARCNSFNKPNALIESLNNYREKKNKKTKLVLVNLHRHKPAMNHEEQKQNGILEICGMDENTPKLINSFALNEFN